MMVEGMIILFEMKCFVSYNNIAVTTRLVVICERKLSFTPQLLVYSFYSNGIKSVDSF